MRKVGDIKCEKTEVSFRFLLTAIDFDGITESLKRIKRDSDRQKDIQLGHIVGNWKMMQDLSKRLIEEIEIFE